MSDDVAATPPNAAAPWGEGKPERADLVLMWAIGISGIYALAMLPLVPTLIGTHPVVLELLRGGTSAMVTMGALARVGEASLFVAVVAAIPGLMLFDWVFWWAGRRWGRNVIGLFLGNHPKAEKRASQLERLTERYGWLAIVVAYFQPVPNPLIYAAAGWTGMRFSRFILLDLIGSLLWSAFSVGLGYAIGQSAVDVARGISRYALYLTIGLLVVIVGRQLWRSRGAATG